MRRARAWLAATALLALAGCGLRPIYAGGGSGPAAATLSQIEVAPIADKGGFLLRQELLRRFGEPQTTRLRLEIVLDDNIIGFGIRGDQSISRERRTLRARYKLIDKETNAVLIDATAGSDVTIDVVSSEYAVVAAENTALERLAGQLADQITLRLATYAAAGPRTAAPAPQPR